ncbi:acyl carrier protein [Streptomyces roseifaciens]|uniref:acyl carrier protein n=1 Tax=Streptomyces roseifaciens TaxID=1488406 RepID=UPI000717EC4A|nr:acyl carrier protein [Streptomyces roseifaciens]
MTLNTEISPVELEFWLIERVASYLRLDTREVDPQESFANLGLDSVYALTLTADIEDTLGIEVEPTLAWDYPTISALAKGLTASMRAAKETV